MVSLRSAVKVFKRAVYCSGGLNELQERVFPSSERRGGCAIKKMLRSLLMKAQTGWSVPDNVTTSTFTIMTTPSAPLRRLRAFFLLAQPPLLFQEGNTLSWQFIHTFIERRYSMGETQGLSAGAHRPGGSATRPS